MNFLELVRTCPTIAELKAGAVSIAEHEARPWFTYWLADSTIFAMAIDAAAEALDVAPAEIRDTALTGLLDAYFTARRRLPTRGALGNGLRVVAGAVLASGGRLTVKTRGRALRLRPRDADGTTEAEHVRPWKGTGTRV